MPFLFFACILFSWWAIGAQITVFIELKTKGEVDHNSGTALFILDIIAAGLWGLFYHLSH